MAVSIPFWVFCPSRPSRRPPGARARDCFNPVLGFLPVATFSGHSAWRVYSCPIKFQSRSGFSARRDTTGSKSTTTTTSCFNPVLGFLPVATSKSCMQAYADSCFNPVLGFLPVATIGILIGSPFCNRVSIPFWVFCPSRPLHHERAGLPTLVSIPFWVFCPSRPPETTAPTPRIISFNPVLGFLPVATWRRNPAARAWNSFNPVLGFLPVATKWVGSVGRYQKLFQSRSGFSARRDDSPIIIERLPNLSFQSRSGFSARRDQKNGRLLTSEEFVSIPFWVFCPSRPSRSSASRKLPGCFNPVLGFLPVATIRRWPPRRWQSTGFNPVLGFLPVAT